MSLLARLLSSFAPAESAVTADATTRAGNGPMLVEDLEGRQLMAVMVPGDDYCGTPWPKPYPPYTATFDSAVIIQPATLTRF